MKTPQLSIKKISALTGIVSLVLILFIVSFSPVIFSGCTKASGEIGIGPVKEEMKLQAVDLALSEKGRQLFQSKCILCHKMDSRVVGPMLKDVTKRRRPEWIMNQILNPQEMMQKDPIAKELFSQYKVPMILQDVSRDDARAILEYFRAVDENKITEVR